MNFHRMIRQQGRMKETLNPESYPMPKLNARENVRKKKQTAMRERTRALRATLKTPAKPAGRAPKAK